MLRPQLTFIRKVVSKTEYELRRVIAVLFNKPLRNFAFVDEPWAYLEVGFTRHHFDIVALPNSLLEMLLALSRLESTPLWVREPIVPGKSDLLGLNERPFQGLAQTKVGNRVAYLASCPCSAGRSLSPRSASSCLSFP